MDFNCGSWTVIENYVYGEKSPRTESILLVIKKEEDEQF